jgi:hypothetical protein
MDKIAGYARVMARTRVEQEMNKPFLGKPYLKYGQCWAVWSYFFQLGGLLGARHSANLDAFATAFSGAHGEPGAAERFFSEVANSLMAKPVSDSTPLDYVGAEFIGRLGHASDPWSFFFENAMQKIKPDFAEELAWQYATDGAALGAMYPGIFREMFERMHAARPKENWERARAAGLNLPVEQDVMSYEEAAEGEDEAFMDYCRRCCPNLYSILIAQPTAEHG